MSNEHGESPKHVGVTASAHDVRCPICGYHIGVLVQACCPECGAGLQWQLTSENKTAFSRRHGWIAMALLVLIAAAVVVTRVIEENARREAYYQHKVDQDYVHDVMAHEFAMVGWWIEMQKGVHNPPPSRPPRMALAPSDPIDATIRSIEDLWPPLLVVASGGLLALWLLTVDVLRRNLAMSVSWTRSVPRLMLLSAVMILVGIIALRPP